ncbi:MAG TPA: type II secretion system protein GspL [Candidatus Acidoferrales bacterium]|nr:type II secretion system protein GspL [Candidatus Acidoferrales bacterium]
MPQRILALEIDAHELKAAVLETTFRDYKVLGFYREAVSDNGVTLADQVKRFVESHDCVGSTVLSSLPGDLVTLRTFFLPFRDRKRLDQTVPFELETQVAFGLDDVVVAYQVLQRDKAGSTVLAALVQRNDLEAHLATLGNAGLDPKVVDFAPLATLNVLSLLGADLPETFAYVTGNLHQTVVALYRNRQLVGLRALMPAAGANAADTETAASSNGHSSANDELVGELVRDIRWTLLALNGSTLDDNLPCFVAGDGIALDEVAQQLDENFGFKVRRVEQSPMRALPAELRAQMGPFTAPLGLALREVSPNDALGLNFRQGEFSYHRGQQEVRRALWGTGAIALLALILFVSNTYMQYEQIEQRLAALNTQIRNVFTQTLPDIRNVRDEKRQLQDEVDAAEKRLKLISGVVPPSGTTAIDAMQRLSTAIPDALKVDVDEYVMDTEDIKIKAKSDSLDTPNAIREAIANTHYFADVQVKNIKSGNDGKVDFQLVLSLNKDAAGPAPTGRQ